MGAIKSFKKFIKESIWSDIQDRSSGETVRKEDDVNNLDLNEFYAYIKDQYKTKVEYIDLDFLGGEDVISVDITENIILFYKPKRGHILLSWSRVKIPMPFFDELADRFKIENPNAMRRIITEKDGSCTNKTFVDAIEFFLEHKDSMMNESIWSDIQDRSSGDTTRKEDDVNLLDKDGLYEYLISHYKPVEGIDIKSYIVCGNSYINLCVFTYPKETRYSILLDILNHRVKVRTPYIKRWPANLLDMIYKKYNREDVIDKNRDLMTFITPKEGKGNNQFYIDFLDMILNNVDKPLLKKVINESIWSDIQDRSSGETVRKEDERHKILERLLATYIKLFAESCYYHAEYTSGSYPDFRAYIKDFRYHPIIEEVCPDDSYFDDLLNYVNKETWYNQIDDTIMEMTDRLYKGEHHLITNEVIEVLRKHNVNESIWSDIQDRSAGDTIRKEDITEEDKKEIDYIFNGFAYLIVYTDYKPTIDDFIKMMKEAYPDFEKDNSKYIAWVRSNWDKKYKDELDKKIQDNKKDVDKRINKYLNNFVGQVVYCEKYNVSLPDIKKFSDEILKHCGIPIEMRFVGKIRVDESWLDIFKKYVDENWNDVKKRINDFIAEENQKIAKTGFKKVPGKRICDILDEWWDSLGDEKDDIAWDEFGERAEEEYYERHNPKYNEYTGEDFDADEEWSNASWIESVEIYMKYNQKTNESIWSDIQDRSTGDVVRKEDEITQDDLDAVDDFIYGFATRVVWDGIRDSLTNFLKYIDENPEALDCDIKRVKKYVEDNWHKSICDDVEAAIEQEDKEKEQDMNESIWSDIQDRSSGENKRREDEVLTDMEINSLNEFTLMYCRRERAHYIQNHIVPPPPSKRKENDYEGLIKYIEDRRDENLFTNVGDYDKIIEYIKKNWDKLDMDTYIKKWICSPDVMKGTKIVECDGVPGGLTPADVGGMGPAYFPGPNGEPGSGDLPSPTGIVYKQVAPYTTFLKQIKKKKKKTKKFRKEDEPCVHSENPPIYSHVDDFRDYVDRVYNQIDRKK